MPVIEEIDDDDIDNRHISLDEFDSHNPFSRETPVDTSAVRLRPTAAPRASSTSPDPAPPASAVDAADEAAMQQLPRREGSELPAYMKEWKVIYPVYFDKSRSVKEGRRVSRSMAVDNPLATMIADACRALNIEPALELTKRHPKDWANPGRVRVSLPEGQSKRDIYARICEHMRAHPASPVTARESMYRSIMPFDSLSPLAVPRNMKIHKILPGVSPALSAQKVIDESMKTDGNQMAKMMGMG